MDKPIYAVSDGRMNCLIGVYRQEAAAKRCIKRYADRFPNSMPYMVNVHAPEWINTDYTIVVFAQMRASMGHFGER